MCHCLENEQLTFFRTWVNERQMLAHTSCTTAPDPLYFHQHLVCWTCPEVIPKPCSTFINNQSSGDDQLPRSAATLETPVCDLGCRDKWKRTARCTAESPAWSQPGLVVGHPWLEVEMDVCLTCRISHSFLYGGVPASPVEGLHVQIPSCRRHLTDRVWRESIYFHQMQTLPWLLVSCKMS